MREGQHEEATRELELEQVAADADGGCGQRRGVDHALVLVQAGAEDLRAVAAEQVDRCHPADDHHRAGDVERLADVRRDVARELDGLASQDRREHAERDQDEVGAEGHRWDVLEPAPCGCADPGGCHHGRSHWNPPISIVNPRGSTRLTQ